MRTSHKILTVLLFFVVLIAAVAMVFEFETPRRARQATVTILRGENVFQIANDLKAEGYVPSKIYFVYETLITGNFKKLKAGEYELDSLDTRKIVDKVAAGQIISKTVTIVPGWDISDVTRSFQAGRVVGSDGIAALKISQFKADFDFLADSPDDAGMEGFLYPDTYRAEKKQAATDLVRIALENFGKKLTPELRQKISLQGKTIFDVVTMAAMLEKEVQTLEDKQVVAGILWKRLEAKMPLQVDSTLLYYKVSSSGAVDKESESPYNTYRYSGLPAGPICNPGIESIEAAVNPTESSYWYYLSAPDGTTIFSKNYGEHLINKAKYLD